MSSTARFTPAASRFSCLCLRLWLLLSLKLDVLWTLLPLAQVSRISIRVFTLSFLITEFCSRVHLRLFLFFLSPLRSFSSSSMCSGTKLVLGMGGGSSSSGVLANPYTQTMKYIALSRRNSWTPAEIQVSLTSDKHGASYYFQTSYTCGRGLLALPASIFSSHLDPSGWHVPRPGRLFACFRRLNSCWTPFA